MASITLILYNKKYSMVPCEFAMKLQGTLSHSLGVVHINKNKIIKLSDYKVQIEGTFS